MTTYPFPAVTLEHIALTGALDRIAGTYDRLVSAEPSEHRRAALRNTERTLRGFVVDEAMAATVQRDAAARSAAFPGAPRLETSWAG